MNVLVIGCGSIGNRHINNLIKLNVGKIYAYDKDIKRLESAKNQFNINVLRDLDSGLIENKIDAAIICTPTCFHIQNALQLIDYGIHCLIEKPLSNGIKDIDKLIKLAQEKSTAILVGYNTRYSILMEKLKGILDEEKIGKVLSIRASCGYYLPYWRPNEDYSTTYSAKSELGGGAVLDFSHEIDYVTWIAGRVDGIFATCKKLSDLEIDTEDYAEVIMHHNNGIISSIHLDYLQANYRRSCEIIGSKGMIVWDLNKKTLEHHNLRDKEYHVFYEGINENINDTYIKELKHFINLIENGSTTECLEESKHVQEIICAIKGSAGDKEFKVV